MEALYELGDILAAIARAYGFYDNIDGSYLDPRYPPAPFEEFLCRYFCAEPLNDQGEICSYSDMIHMAMTDATTLLVNPPSDMSKEYIACTVELAITIASKHWRQLLVPCSIVAYTDPTFIATVEQGTRELAEDLTNALHGADLPIGARVRLQRMMHII